MPNSARAIGVFAVRLLWRHVLRRADDGPLLRGDERSALMRISGYHLRLGQPEIEQLDARLRAQNIRGLQVAMNDVPLMRSTNPLGNIAGDLQRPDPVGAVPLPGRPQYTPLQGNSDRYRTGRKYLDAAKPLWPWLPAQNEH